MDGEVRDVRRARCANTIHDGTVAQGELDAVAQGRELPMASRPSLGGVSSGNRKSRGCGRIDGTGTQAPLLRPADEYWLRNARGPEDERADPLGTTNLVGPDAQSIPRSSTPPRATCRWLARRRRGAGLRPFGPGRRCRRGAG